jgi:predicted SAM-dependent methyltransferase
MPSLDVILDKAMSGHWRDQHWLTLPEHRRVATRAEMLNMVFRDWGHRWLYDREELERRVREAGYAKLAFPKNGESEHAELRGRESRPDSLLICEVTKE